MSESTYQPEKGTEDYVHVRVTHKQGQALAEPVIEHYHPSAWGGVSRLAGFKAEVVHDPRTSALKQATAPLASEVKSAEHLTTPEQYRARYQELFKEDAPFNIAFDELKLTVDRANAKLAELQGGEQAVTDAQARTDAQRTADEQQQQQQQQQDGTDDKLPTAKKEWYAEFQKAFPQDTTAYDDITVNEIRERLGK